MKRIYAIAAITLLVGGLPGLMSARSHSFFRRRPVSQDLVLENALHAYDIYYRPCIEKTETITNEKGDQVEFRVDDGGPVWSLRPSYYYFHGTDARRLGAYFLPNNQSCIRVAQNNRSDVSSPWLKIVTPPNDPFASTFCLRPRLDIWGSSWLFRFERGATEFFGRTIYPWISIFVPFVWVNTKLDVCERVDSRVGTPPGFPTVCAAMNNPDWCNGRLSGCERTKWGIDDIELKLGADLIKCPNLNLGTYALAFIPTGTKSKAHCLWEPTIGAGPHLGLGFGLRGDMVLGFLNDLIFLYELRYAYFLQGKERRSFDLVNGDWSRYLLVSSLADLDAGIIRGLPGINFLTSTARVTPGSTVDLFLAARYVGEYLNFELGYNFWWRDREKVRCIACPQDFAIFDIDGVCPPGKTSASTASIDAALPGPGGPVSDRVIRPVRLADYDFGSAAHPSALSSKWYVATSACRRWFGYEGMWGLGMSYERAHKRSALSQFGLWVTSGIYF